MFKELLVGLAVGDNNNYMQVDGSSVHHCGCVDGSLIY